MAEAKFTLRAVDDTRQAFASVQNNLSRLQKTASVVGRSLTQSLDIRRAMTSVAVAIGLSVNAIAENVARFLTNTSKEGEDLINKSNDLEDRLAESRNTNYEDRITAEELLFKLEADRQKLLRQEKETSGALRGSEEYNKSLQTQIELEAINAKIRGETIKYGEQMTAANKAMTDSTDALAKAQAGLYNGEALSIAEQLSDLRDREGAIMYKMAGIGLEDAEKRIELNYKLASVMEQITVLMEEQSRAAMQAGEMIAFGFEDAILSGEKLSTVLKQLGLDLVRLVFQNVVTAPLAKGLGGFISEALKPRAEGGPVNSGRSYIVGERGPELFVPGSSGSIVPNDAMRSGGGGGGPSVNITYNIAAGVTRSELGPLLESERKRLKAEIPDMVRRGGAYRAAFA
jgi:hypothetical protein